jgi:type IV pilus assembly protein PilB
MSKPTLLDMRAVKIDPVWALRIPPALALRRQVLPFACVEDRVFVACANLEDSAALEAVARFVGKEVQAELADAETLRPLIQRIFGSLQNTAGSESRPLVRNEPKNGAEADTSDIVPICDELLYAALVREASDIHLDPGPECMTVRLRVDGYLEPYRTLPMSLHASLMSRLKVLSALDIAEKRSPQDGGFTHRYGNSQQAVDIRVATLPTKYGERMTLRLLAMQTETLTVEKLGMVPRDQALFERMISLPHGMILLTGPTGSGKTTTLYSALRRLIQAQVGNIITIEDPIEYAIAGVAQVEVDSADKISFGRALRSVLRHDPDVVMIGEIRDHETADVAIKASLTGHLVLSTLHTNSAAGVVTRMQDMGVERYLIGATLRLAVTQRLVRKLCSYCREIRPLTLAEAISLGRSAEVGRSVADAVGCKYCANRGYGGRIGLFEMLPSDEELSRRIALGCSEAELIQYAREQGRGLLIDDAAEKLFSFTTSPKEVLEAVATW